MDCFLIVTNKSICIIYPPENASSHDAKISALEEDIVAGFANVSWQ